MEGGNFHGVPPINNELEAINDHWKKNLPSSRTEPLIGCSKQSG